MKIEKVWIVNLWGKAFSGFSKGKLNASMCEVAEQVFQSQGCEVKYTKIADGNYKVEDELEKYQWADFILFQSPTNWMGLPWEGKKWADEVWTPAMGGQLCQGDGRHKDTPEDGYGTGGTLNGKPYMLSLTFNAPKGSFDRPGEYLFQGKSVDDLWFPFHCNCRFFDMKTLPTFATFDVLKNPKIEEDKTRFKKHLMTNVFPGADMAA